MNKSEYVPLLNDHQLLLFKGLMDDIKSTNKAFVHGLFLVFDIDNKGQQISSQVVSTFGNDVPGVHRAVKMILDTVEDGDYTLDMPNVEKMN